MTKSRSWLLVVLSLLLIVLGSCEMLPAETPNVTHTLNTLHVIAPAVSEARSLKFIYLMSNTGKVIYEGTLIGDVTQGTDAIEWIDQEGGYHKQFLSGTIVHLSTAPMNWRAKRTPQDVKLILPQN